MTYSSLFTISLLFLGLLYRVEGKSSENMFLIGIDKPMKEFPFPKAPFSFGAMEPSIDTETMKIHFSDIFKHHTTHLNRLMKKWRNSADKDLKSFSQKSLIEMWTNKGNISNITQVEFFKHGAAYMNHLLYFSTMSSPSNNPGKTFPKKFAPIMERSHLSSVDDLKAKMKEFVAEDIFSSGWVFVVRGGGFGHDSLSVMVSFDEMSPLEFPKVAPILAFDVWEHAYINKYGVNKMEYFEKWWNTVDWLKVEQIFDYWRKVEGYTEKVEL